MTTNNYDSNSKGLNIDLTIMRDEFLARINFDENFKRIEEDVYLYIDFDNLSKDFIVTITEENNKKLKNIVLENDLNYYYDNDNLENNEFIDCIERSYNDSKIELYDFCLNNEIEIEERYKTMYVTGYSQGDRARILVNTKEFKNHAGSKFDSKIHGDIFTNYFYDQPIYCNIIVNGDDYCVELTNEYAYYDSDVIEEIITWCVDNIEVENKELLKEEIEQLLPSVLY